VVDVLDGSILALLVIALIYVAWRVEKVESALKRAAAAAPDIAAQRAPLKGLKRKRRYLVFSVISDKPFSSVEELGSSLRAALSACLGEVRFHDCKPEVVFYSPGRSRGVIRTAKDCADEVAGCLSMIREARGARLLIIPVRLTGTLRRARWYLFDRRVSG